MYRYGNGLCSTLLVRGSQATTPGDIVFVGMYLKETYPPGRIFRWYRRYTTYAVGPFFRQQAERLFRLELVFSTLPQPITTRPSPRVVEDVRGCQARAQG